MHESNYHPRNTKHRGPCSSWPVTHHVTPPLNTITDRVTGKSNLMSCGRRKNRISAQRTHKRRSRGGQRALFNQFFQTCVELVSAVTPIRTDGPLIGLRVCKYVRE